MGLFDDMDDFEGNDSGFGNLDSSFGGDFDDNIDFGDTSNSFGTDNMNGNNAFSGANTSSEDADFSGAFEDDDNSTLGQNNNGGNGLKKQAIITIIVGVIGILLVIFIATRISSCSKQKDEDTNGKSNVTQTTDRDGQNVDNIMSDNKVTRPSGNSQNKNEETEGDWVSIDNSQKVEFNKQYQELMFTVTGIKHLAKKVDINGNLVIKTQLTGSISGLTGSYTIDIPYSKGVKLVVGDSFTVNVQLGTYSGKTVVGEIVY